MNTKGEQFLKIFWQHVVERVDSYTQYLVYLCDTQSQFISEISTDSLLIKSSFSNWNMVDFLFLFPVILKVDSVITRYEVILTLKISETRLLRSSQWQAHKEPKQILPEPALT